MKNIFKIVLSVLVSCLVVFAQTNKKTEKEEWLAARLKCIDIFKYASAPSKQPKSGTFNVEEVALDDCISKERSTYGKYLKQGDSAFILSKKELYVIDRLERNCFQKEDTKKCESFLYGEDAESLRDGDGNTLFLKAALKSDYNAVMYLMDKKFNIKAFNYKGENALHLALKNNYEQMDPAALWDDKNKLIENQLLIV